MVNSKITKLFIEGKFINQKNTLILILINNIGRYASLFFIAGTDPDDNELLVLEIIHRYVEVLDKWFLNVCELDIIFNFQQAYTIMVIYFCVI